MDRRRLCFCRSKEEKANFIKQREDLRINTNDPKNDDGITRFADQESRQGFACEEFKGTFLAASASAADQEDLIFIREQFGLLFSSGASLLSWYSSWQPMP